MRTVQVDDVAEYVFELEGDAGQCLTTTVQVVQTSRRFVEDDVPEARGNWDLFDDISLT